jgi:LacI family transcriptional regulator, galactose operon repressor
MTEPQISQKKIAEEAGVSIMTVSRVLRGKEDVADETRERVLEVARKFRYRPNLLVRGIQTGKTNTIGVLLPLWPFYDQISSGIHDELIQADHVPMTIWSASDAHDRSIDAAELKQIHRLLDRRVDGVILKPVDEAVSDDYLREVWERGIPLVVLDRELPRTHADFVGTDDYVGGELAAEHLLSLGHRRLGLVVPGRDVTPYALRESGFTDAVAKASGAVCTVHECVQTDGDMYRCVKSILEQTPPPTAMFFTTDSAAPIACEAAREMGLRIPDDLSLLGFGNLAMTKHMDPPLTTLDQFPYKIGRRAAGLLLERSAGRLEDESPVRIRLKPELVLRASTASPVE